MDARQRIRIIAAAGAVAALAGGRATAQEDSVPPEDSIADTDVRRAARECESADPGPLDFGFYDDGLGVLVHPDSRDTAECILGVLDLPEWVGYVNFVGVLRFGDWAVMKDLGDGGLLILDNEVAPDN